MKWLLGIAAGVTVVYLLRTDKGKKMLTDLKTQVNDLSDTICNATGDLFKKAKSAVS
ncbi:YtxH domain-containing protein [Sediminibacterium soli]|uniref:YtxH domain-containing protein n=1 Tax=Sediminibacterium soli TaxID=2698829 RepID=UPI00137A43D7|nr:YtxH domain-containing protein [Sediminibacterium soli]NCI45245.1 YtxH domain-containing protein [Sediminibacterium soli]